MDKKILFAGFFLLLAIVASPEVSAKDYTKNLGKEVVLYKDVTIESLYYKSADRIQIDGTVNGDTYLAAKDIIINGTVNGDLFAIGGKLVINGNVDGDVRVLSSNVEINGKISGSMLVFAESAVIGEGGSLEKDLYGGMSSFAHSGNIGRDVRIFASKMEINGKIGRNFTYYSDKNAQIPDETNILGSVKMVDLSKTPGFRNESSAGERAVASLLSILSLFLTAVGINYVFGGKIQEVSKEIQKNVTKSIIVGFLSLVITPILILVSLMSLITFPLVLIFSAIYFISLYISPIFSAYVLGSHTLQGKRKNGVYVKTFTGITLLKLIGYIPILGFVFNFIALLAGFGAISIWAKRKLYLSKRKK